MADERIDHGSLPVRHQLLSFLVSVAKVSTPSGWNNWSNLPDEDALYEGEAAANAFFAHSVLSCVAVTPVLLKSCSTDWKTQTLVFGRGVQWAL
jgi:hypothetical protein